MAKVKDFLLEMLAALAGAGGSVIEDNDVSSLLAENTKIIKKSNAFNENASFELDSIYNFLVANKNMLNQKTESDASVTRKNIQSPIPNIDSFFDLNGYIPVMVLNPEYIGGDDGFDVDLPDRVKPKPSRPRPTRPRSTTPRPGPGGRPGGFNPNGRPSTGGPARQPRIPPGTALPKGYTRNSAGRIINSKTGQYASATEILDEIEKAGKWARYSKLLKFLRAAGYVGVAMAFIDPIYAMYIGAPESEIKKQLAGAMGSIGGATLGAIIGAAGITAIPVVGQSGVANIAGGLVGGIVGAVAGEWLIESLVEYLFDTSSGAEAGQPPIENPLPNYGEGDSSYTGEPATIPPPPVIDPITGVEISGDIQEPIESSPVSPMLNPVSYSPNGYANTETRDNESLTISAGKIDFIGDTIRFIYNTVGDGTVDTGNASLMSASYGSSATQGGGSGVMPQEGPLPPGATQTPTPQGTPGGSGFLGFSGNLVKVTSKSGKSAWVAAEHASRFQGFINDLEATGYVINDLGGYNYRPNVNAPQWLSYHGLGAAIDINAANNPNGTTRTDMPPETAALAEKWGLGWGMKFQDPMHFSAAKKEHGYADIPKQYFDNTRQPNVTYSQGPAVAPSTQPTAETAPTSGTTGGGSTSTPIPPPVSTGKTVSAKSTETYANAKIPNALGPGPTSQPATIVTASSIDPPFETAGVSKPLFAMTKIEQSVFEQSGMFA